MGLVAARRRPRGQAAKGRRNVRTKRQEEGRNVGEESQQAGYLREEAEICFLLLFVPTFLTCFVVKQRPMSLSVCLFIYLSVDLYTAVQPLSASSS